MIAFALLGGGYFLVAQATEYATVFSFLIVMGLALTVWASRLVASQVYGVSPLDPLSLAATVALLLGTAAAAAAVPAFRASRVDPIRVLKED